MGGCRLCRSPQLRFVADFGKLAVTNQFITPGGPAPFRQPIAWQECRSCGAVQLVEAPPLSQIRPRFPWLTYQEPEAHLDLTAQDLRQVVPAKSGQRVFGLAQDDWPLLKRLDTAVTQVLDPREDLGITHEQYGMETIQASWTIAAAEQAAARYGRAEIFVARYALEHAHDGAAFLAACREFLVPGGILLIEVPDSAQAFRDLDVTTVWEEHLLYLTEQTLQLGMAAAGFEMRHFRRVPDRMEDRLVWIGQAGQNPPQPPLTTFSEGVPNPDILNPDVAYFSRDWPQRRSAIQTWAKSLAAQGERLAVFGAGHRACTLIDATGIAEFVDCVIDDSAEKQKFQFPAGALPICGSAALVDRQIRCCLLAVSPAVEDRIVARNAEFVSSGGTFVSCYPCSLCALRWS